MVFNFFCFNFYVKIYSILMFIKVKRNLIYGVYNLRIVCFIGLKFLEKKRIKNNIKNNE